MPFWGIPNGDSLFRHAVYPVSFKKTDSYIKAIFVPEKVVRFQEQPDGSLVTSVAWERYAPTAKEIHGYGCRMAHHQNRKIAGPITPQKRRVYCGAYQLTAKAVRELATQNPGEISRANVKHHIEGGEIAHTDLRIAPNPNVPLDSVKTVLLDRLWNAYSGPLRHKCDCDRDIDPHPSSKLSTPFRGDYADTRTCLSRRWYVVRFRALHWLWRVRSRVSHRPESEQPLEKAMRN